MTEPERLTERRSDVAWATFEGFYHSTRSGTLAVVLALRGSKVGAEEVAQEAYIRAFRRWDEVAVMDRPDLWVHTVALNLATSHLRRLAAEARALSRLAVRRQPEVPAAEAAAEDFWRLVRQLPAKHRKTVALRYAADLPVADIASVLGCPEGTVKSRLHTARTRLADLLGEEAS